MAKLTKTQQALLARAKDRKSDTISVERFWGHGSEGGKVSGGYREMNAAIGLEEAGLAERMHYHSSMTCVGNGYHVHNRILVIRFKPEILS